MALRIVNTGRLDELELYTRRLEAEVSDLKADIAARDHQFAELQQQLLDAKRPQPTTLAEVVNALRGLLPGMTASSGVSLMARATDAKSFAQGINLLAQEARLIGRNEVAK